MAEATPPRLAEFVHIRIITDATEGMRAATAEFLGALGEIRLEGNPEPRAAAEEITALLGGLVEHMPHTRRPKRRRKAEEEQFLKVHQAFGKAHKQFTLACRRDVGYARPLRRHWWQWWRPNSEEQWPGGWPGPAARDLLGEAERSQVIPVSSGSGPVVR